MTNTQLSLLERGSNVKADKYQAVAKAMGFRDALEMFRAGADPSLRRLLRYWPLLDEAARKDVLNQVKAQIDADEAPSATSSAE